MGLIGRFSRLIRPRRLDDAWRPVYYQTARRVDAIMDACDEVVSSVQGSEIGWDTRHERARSRLRKTLSDRDSYFASTMIEDRALRLLLDDFHHLAHQFAAYDVATLDRRGVLHPLPPEQRPVRQRDRSAVLIELQNRLIATAAPLRQRLAEATSDA